MQYSENCTVKSVIFRIPNFQSFSPVDLDRLKNDDKWLSDSHITFALQYVPLIRYFFPLLKRNRDCYNDCLGRGIWGDLKIQLLDTIFWAQLKGDPDKFVDRFRTKVDLLNQDFIVMPMFES
jgi:hypothetical protein